MQKPLVVQKSGRGADDANMSRLSCHRILSVSVLAAILGLGLVACGSEEVSSTAGEAAPTTGVADAPDRDAGDEVPRTVDRTAFDDAESLFASTVGRDYVMTFELISQVSAEAGPIRVEVVDGRPGDVAYPDAMSEQILQQIPMLTVNDFFERARSVLADGGAVEVEFDEFYGYPLTMTLDPIPEAIDDEMSIVVQSVEITELPPETDGY